MNCSRLLFFYRAVYRYICEHNVSGQVHLVLATVFLFCHNINGVQDFLRSCGAWRGQNCCIRGTILYGGFIDTPLNLPSQQHPDWMYHHQVQELHCSPVESSAGSGADSLAHHQGSAPNPHGTRKTRRIRKRLHPPKLLSASSAAKQQAAQKHLVQNRPIQRQLPSLRPQAEQPKAQNSHLYHHGRMWITHLNHSYYTFISKQTQFALCTLLYFISITLHLTF